MFIHKVKPMQSVLRMVFPISIGMLNELAVIWRNAARVLSLVLTATIAKSALCYGMLRAFVNRTVKKTTVRREPERAPV